MTTHEIIQAAKNTVITKKMIDEMKIRIHEFDEKCKDKNNQMNTEQLNRVYSDID